MRLIWEDETAVAERLAGTEGAAVSVDKVTIKLVMVSDLAQ